jgi:hypothetical protein
VTNPRGEIGDSEAAAAGCRVRGRTCGQAAGIAALASHPRMADTTATMSLRLPVVGRALDTHRLPSRSGAAA